MEIDAYAAGAAGMIRQGDLEGLRRLLAEQPAVAGARLADGASLLSFAAYCGSAPAVQAILAVRPELDVYEACILGDAAPVLAALAEGWSADTRAPDGFTALGLAAFFRRTEVFDLLLPLTGDLNARAENAQSVAAIHAATSAGDHVAVEKLLVAGADANLAQSRGLTALHAAAARGDVKLVALLLRFGADAQRADETGKRPADYAQAAGHVGLAGI
jgi:uncharacterized protein